VADQSVCTITGVIDGIRRGVGDIYVVGFSEAGGLLPLKKIAACLEGAHLPLNRKGMVGETGASTLAALQVLVTIPNLAGGRQMMHQLLAKDIVVDGLLMFEGGRIQVPERPGLGIELDLDQVAKFARNYEKVGQYPMNPN